MNIKFIEKFILEDYYNIQKLNPYEIGKILNCDHKTVRAYMVKHGIKTRSASEYNYLPKKSHTSPTTNELYSPLSIADHIAYLCEGWHTSRTNRLNFTNQDSQLVKLFIECLRKIYKYSSPIGIFINYNFMKNESFPTVDRYKEIFSKEKVYLPNDSTRKNAILRVDVGGKNLAREFIANAYDILNKVNEN
jgi:hypothetical protein